MLPLAPCELLLGMGQLAWQSPLVVWLSIAQSSSGQVDPFFLRGCLPGCVKKIKISHSSAKKKKECDSIDAYIVIINRLGEYYPCAMMGIVMFPQQLVAFPGCSGVQKSSTEYVDALMREFASSSLVFCAPRILHLAQEKRHPRCRYNAAATLLFPTLQQCAQPNVCSMWQRKPHIANHGTWEFLCGNGSTAVLWKHNLLEIPIWFKLCCRRFYGDIVALNISLEIRWCVAKMTIATGWTWILNLRVAAATWGSGDLKTNCCTILPETERRPPCARLFSFCKPYKFQRTFKIETLKWT